MDAVSTFKAVCANTHTDVDVNKQVVKWNFGEKRECERKSRTANEREGERD